MGTHGRIIQISLALTRISLILEELLKYIQERTPFIGSGFSFGAGSLPLEMLAYTESVHSEESVYLLDYLIAQGWIEVVGLHQVRDEVIAV